MQELLRDLFQPSACYTKNASEEKIKRRRQPKTDMKLGKKYANERGKHEQKYREGENGSLKSQHRNY